MHAVYISRGRVRLGSARGGIHDICGTARGGERASASRGIVEAIGRGTGDYKRGYPRGKTGQCRKRKDEGIEEDTWRAIKNGGKCRGEKGNRDQRGKQTVQTGL